MPSSLSDAVRIALAHGAVASVGLTLARWATDEPYSPLLVPFDLFVCVAAALLLYVLAAAAARRSHWSVLAGRLGILALVFLLWLPLWSSQLLGAGGGAPVLRLLRLALLAGALGLTVRSSLRRAPSRIPFGWFALWCGIALSLDIGLVHGRAVSGAMVPMAFPAVLLLSLLAGRPSVGPEWRARSLGPPLLVLGISATCALTVFPASAERVDLPQGAPSAGDRSGQGRSVILIVLDTLRHDHMSLYGYPLRTTPHVDRWAQSGLVFDDVTSASPWTLPSHASMFTGLYPRSHGAHAYRGSAPTGNAHALPQEIDTLAEIASRNGIETSGIAANWAYLRPGYGLSQGFATYWAAAPRHPVAFAPADALAARLFGESYRQSRWPYYRDRYVTDNALRWLRQIGDRRFFLFLNYMDVHGPSRRPPNEVVPALPGEEGGPARRPPGRWQTFLAQGSFPDGFFSHAIAQTDRELMHLDAQLDRLFRHLDEQGLSSSTVVILTSDHGEAYGEHGMAGHLGHLHEEVIRIPLVVRGPGVPAGRTSRPTHAVEIFDLVLDYLSIREIGRSEWQAELPEIVAEWYASVNALLLAPEMGGRFDRDIRSIRVGGLKLFVDSRGRVELFDLDSVGGEDVDLAAQRPEDVEGLSSRLREWLAANRAPDRPVDPPSEGMKDEAIREKLRALGYLQ